MKDAQEEQANQPEVNTYNTYDNENEAPLAYPGTSMEDASTNEYYNEDEIWEWLRETVETRLEKLQSSVEHIE